MMSRVFDFPRAVARTIPRRLWRRRGTMDMQTGVLVPESFYETVYRLQEAHWRVRGSRKPERDQAVDRLRTRLVESDGGLQWQRTDLDRELTGDSDPDARRVRAHLLDEYRDHARTPSFLLAATPAVHPARRRYSGALRSDSMCGSRSTR
jgi:hypothetical protein